MKLRWLCIFLLVCLMSGSGIADDSNQENTQGSTICKNKYATNLELCKETTSPYGFVQRCLEDPTFCSPENQGKVQAINKDTSNKDTGNKNTDEQSHADDDVSWEVSWEGNWADFGLDSDETLAALGILLEALNLEGSLSEEEWENTVDPTFWEAFWGAFLGAFLGGFMSELDDETLTDLNELLESEIFWEAFWQAYIDALGTNEDMNFTLGTNELFDKAYFAGMEVALEVDWIDPEEAGRKMFETAYAACGDQDIALEVTMNLLLALYQEGSLSEEQWGNAGYAALLEKFGERFRGTHGADKAYYAGMQVAWEVDWIDPAEAGREMFEVAYAACGDQDIALEVTLNVLLTLYKDGSLSAKRLESAGYAALLGKLGETFWGPYDVGMEVAQEVNWTDPKAAVLEMFEAAYVASGDQDIALEVTLNLLGALYKEGSLSEEQVENARYAVLEERFGKNIISDYEITMEVARRVNWTDPDEAGREIFKAAYAGCKNSYIALEVTLDLLKTLYQEGSLSEEQWGNAVEIAFWDQLLLLPFLTQT